MWSLSLYLHQGRGTTISTSVCGWHSFNRLIVNSHSWPNYKTTSYIFAKTLGNTCLLSRDWGKIPVQWLDDSYSIQVCCWSSWACQYDWLQWYDYSYSVHQQVEKIRHWYSCRSSPLSIHYGCVAIHHSNKTGHCLWRKQSVSISLCSSRFTLVCRQKDLALYLWYLSPRASSTTCSVRHVVLRLCLQRLRLSEWPRWLSIYLMLMPLLWSQFDFLELQKVIACSSI